MYLVSVNVLKSWKKWMINTSPQKQSIRSSNGRHWSERMLSVYHLGPCILLISIWYFFQFDILFLDNILSEPSKFQLKLPLESSNTWYLVSGKELKLTQVNIYLDPPWPLFISILKKVPIYEWTNLHQTMRRANSENSNLSEIRKFEIFI